METSEVFAAARTPRTLWVELTSKCPFDCIFCSRQMRRGAGEHLPLNVFRTLVEQIEDPRKLILNYSGESTVYPDLIPAIRLGYQAGAWVELVSALANAPESLLVPLRDSGLNRLTVSVHAVDGDRFAAIYRHGDFETQRARLERFVELCRARPGAPTVDLAFVAMDANLDQLEGVAALADGLGLRDLSIFPVMRRDPIPAQFPTELTGTVTHHRDFEERVRTAVRAAEAGHPGVRFHVAHDGFGGDEVSLGEVPRPYPRELPPRASIHSCEQSPWETAHVLSNGDVVVCEVLDRVPMGNLRDQPLAEIWNGAVYQQFRARYQRGEVAECRTCAWKRAHLPGPLMAEVVAARGMSAQLLYGWHEPAGEEHIWSSQQAAAVLKPRRGSRVLHVSGLLPPGGKGAANQLSIRVNGTDAGTVTNPWEETIDFGIDFPVESDGEIWRLEFRTSHLYRPIEHGDGTDQRDLGFALVLAVAKQVENAERVARGQRSLEPLMKWLDTVDGWGRAAVRRWGRRKAGRLGEWKPGLTVLIPERDNPGELAQCLTSVRRAANEWREPLDTMVVVNGSTETAYRRLRAEYPEVRWQFHDRALGFTGAVDAGLRQTHRDWVYLLNDDVVLDPAALRAVGEHRGDGVFSVASQIVLKDETRFREETNWTTLLVEDGLATVHDWIPKSEQPAATFYAGGGASLFRTRLLRNVLSRSVYHPFYWEDVEWGWRARKLGYESVFCPESIAHHTQHATIGRLYAAEDVERIVTRNRLLFQLRNFTETGSVERAMEAIARTDDVEYFLTARVKWQIGRGRFWNHRAPVTDEEVFGRWTGPGRQEIQSRS